MKVRIIFAMVATARLLAIGTGQGATFTNLHSFSNDDFSSGSNPQLTNSDGIGPNGFVISGNTIYGTASSGGLYGYGTVFRMDLDGSHFTNLFNFNEGAYNSVSASYPDNTGATPSPGLALLGNTLFGTTHFGGPVLAGSVFKINTDGTGFATLYAFHYADGQDPQYGLVLYSNMLYGATVLGGTNGWGNIFIIDPANSSNISFPYQFTNEVDPYGGLAMTSDGIYGFGRWGLSQKGLIYKLGAGGYSILYTFTGANGSLPESTPVISGNTIFGTTTAGGIYGNGNVFRINTDASAYTNLYSFTPNGGANTDGSGAYNYTGVVLSGNKIYGTAAGSGSGGQGTVWQLNTDGTGFKILHSFSYVEGSNPENLLLAGGTLYGGTLWGVRGLSLGVGALFAITIQPTLNFTSQTNRLVLTWNDPTFSLYSAANLTGTFTNISGAHSPYTNTISGRERYFRLQ